MDWAKDETHDNFQEEAWLLGVGGGLVLSDLDLSFTTGYSSPLCETLVVLFLHLSSVGQSLS